MENRIFPITRAQREALARIHKRTVSESNPAASYRNLRRAVLPMFGGNGAVIVPWAGMWLAIEPDGYTHS